MGVGPTISSGLSPVKGNPVPSNFKVLDTYRIGIHVAAWVNYPDAINFEGSKILVVENISLTDITSLDPHFTKYGPVVARFEPTNRGWNLARDLVNTLSIRAN